MAEPFLSEIRMMSFGFAPKGWAMCNGQLLPIMQNQALFSLLGTTYGGDGRTNFALPDNRGRTPIHVGNGHSLGERAGEQNHTVIVSEMPQHNHFVTAISTADTGNNVVNPSGQFFASSTPATLYNSAGANLTSLAANTVANVGGSQPHQNMQPYLTINFCIALQGIYPSQT
ncbi:MAG: tail fiber protein [Arcicella sp.]|nr:tail fiber protein [Arcicella sp.]